LIPNSPYAERLRQHNHILGKQGTNDRQISQGYQPAIYDDCCVARQPTVPGVQIRAAIRNGATAPGFPRTIAMG